MLKVMIDFEVMGNFMDYMIVICYEFKLVRKERLYHLFALDGDAIGLKNG